MSIEMVKAIKLLRSTAEFSFDGDDYSTIKWDVLEGEAPTLKEVEEAITQVKATEDADKAAKTAQKDALLERLGITTEEATLLLG
jgi:hypothetical protein